MNTEMIDMLRKFTTNDKQGLILGLLVGGVLGVAATYSSAAKKKEEAEEVLEILCEQSRLWEDMIDHMEPSPTITPEMFESWQTRHDFIGVMIDANPNI